MPTFTPPIAPGPASVGGRSHSLWHHYGHYDCGLTVWKDQLGAWHQEMMPYQGGFIDRHYDDNSFVAVPDTSVESLANAQEVYMGGSSYEVTEAKADELRAAGFFVGGHWGSEENKWTNYVIASEVNRGFKGGDACSAILTTSAGQSLWVHADTLIGTTNADGFLLPSTFVKNSLVIQDSNGVITSQGYAGGGVSPAWFHPTALGFTPMDMVYDGVGTGVDNILVIGWTEPANYGQVNGEGLIMRLTVFLSPQSWTDYPLVDNPYEILPAQGKFNVTSVYNDSTTGYHYIIGRDQILHPAFSYPFTTFNVAAQIQWVRMARAPLGQLTTPANWEYWTGSAWVVGQTPAVLEDSSRLRDNQNNPLDGVADLTKVGNDYILALIHPRSPSIMCYRSTSPQGPWDLYHVAANPDRRPDKGAHPPTMKKYWSSFPKFLEFKNPNANTLVVMHSHGVSGVNPADNSGVPDHASQHIPNIVYVPTPSVAA